MAAGVARATDRRCSDATEELAALQLAFERVGAEQARRLFTVLGPAGIGKSRLVSEFAAGTACDVLKGAAFPTAKGSRSGRSGDRLRTRRGRGPRRRARYSRRCRARRRARHERDRRRLELGTRRGGAMGVSPAARNDLREASRRGRARGRPLGGARPARPRGVPGRLAPGSRAPRLSRPAGSGRASSRLAQPATRGRRPAARAARTGRGGVAAGRARDRSAGPGANHRGSRGKPAFSRADGGDAGRRPGGRVRHPDSAFDSGPPRGAARSARSGRAGRDRAGCRRRPRVLTRGRERSRAAGALGAPAWSADGARAKADAGAGDLWSRPGRCVSLRSHPDSRCRLRGRTEEGSRGAP